MKLIDLSSEKEKIKSLYRAVCLITGTIIVITIIYGVVATITQGADVVGETLVNIEFPSMSLAILFYAKPITWLFASVIAFWFSFIELNKERIMRLSSVKKHYMMLISFFVGAMALYEVLFNFTLWGGLIAAHEAAGTLNPDFLKNPFPNPKIPWNLVFATKLILALTINAFYTFFFLWRVEQEKESREGKAS